MAPLAVPPPGKALLAAFKGDLPAALLAEQYERAARYLATHGHAARGDPHEDLLQVRSHAIVLTKKCPEARLLALERCTTWPPHVSSQHWHIFYSARRVSRYINSIHVVIQGSAQMPARLAQMAVDADAVRLMLQPSKETRR